MGEQLAKITRGRLLPPSGAAAHGRMHGPGYVFDGGTGRGRPRLAPDPDDTRLVALEQQRVPAAERRVDRAQASMDGARGPAWFAAWARWRAARWRLRRAQRQAEDHRDDIDARSAGYRPLAGLGRDRNGWRAGLRARGAAGADGVAPPPRGRRPRPRARSSPGARRR